MTIEKAIEILTDILRKVETGDPPEEHDAISLGIQALSRIHHQRRMTVPIHQPPLNGESMVG